MRNWKRLVGLATWLLVGAGSCCSDEPKLKVRDMGGRLDYSFKWASSVSFDASMAFDFDARFDFRAWGGFAASGWATRGFDFTGKLGYAQTLTADLDDDGVAETVKLVAIGASGPSSPERVYLAWSGDEYTRDAGRCYVMWWEGSKLELLNGACGSTEPALHCEMANGHATSLSCDVCGSADCASCSASDVSTCISEGTKLLDRTPAVSPRPGGAAGASGSATNYAGESAGAGRSGVSGAAGAITSAGVAGMVAAAGAGGIAGNAGAGAAAGFAGIDGVGVGGQIATGLGGASSTVSAAFTACLGQVQSLVSMATGCSLGTLRDANDLCTNRLPDVAACASAVATGILTSSCKALQSSPCQGVF